MSDTPSRHVQVKFGCTKSESLPTCCERCELLHDCWGECPKRRSLRTPDGEPRLDGLCPGPKKVFSHAVPTAALLAREIDAMPRAARHGM